MGQWPGRFFAFQPHRTRRESMVPRDATFRDMGATHRIAGFTYLPRQDGLLNGVVEKYRFETSADRATWTTNIADGSSTTFGIIRVSSKSPSPRSMPVTSASLPCRQSGEAAGQARRKSRSSPPPGTGSDGMIQYSAGSPPFGKFFEKHDGFFLKALD